MVIAATNDFQTNNDIYNVCKCTGITVNVCLPGAESPAAKAWNEKFPALYEKQMEQLPMHRLGDPETDIGAALTFLAGPDSKFYSGQSFILDGANSIMP